MAASRSATAPVLSSTRRANGKYVEVYQPERSAISVSPPRLWYRRSMVRGAVLPPLQPGTGGGAQGVRRLGQDADHVVVGVRPCGAARPGTRAAAGRAGPASATSAASTPSVIAPSSLGAS